MPNSYFQFKQFRIQQDKCAMKVGTDGVLLGAWTNPGNASRILDIGTGTGIIAIMLAQRSEAMIDAIEIDESAYSQALENGNSCPWSNRLRFFHTSFKNYMEESKQVYDLVVSNPPYHKETIRSPHFGRDTARQSLNLSYSFIIESAAKLLNNKGRISLILPASEENTARNLASKHSLFCTRITHLLPTPGKESSRSLLEFSYVFIPPVEDNLVIEENGRHKYSPAYIHITRDYYLNIP